jgi:hypothetical protein
MGPSGIYVVFRGTTTTENRNADKDITLTTFEKWPEGVKPTSVIYDWGGPPVGEFHRSALEDV